MFVSRIGGRLAIYKVTRAPRGFRLGRSVTLRELGALAVLRNMGTEELENRLWFDGEES